MSQLCAFVAAGVAAGIEMKKQNQSNVARRDHNIDTNHT